MLYASIYPLLELQLPATSAIGTGGYGAALQLCGHRQRGWGVRTGRAGRLRREWRVAYSLQHAQSLLRIWLRVKLPVRTRNLRTSGGNCRQRGPPAHHIPEVEQRPRKVVQPDGDPI